MRLRNYIAMAAIVLGVILSFVWKDPDYQLITDINRIVFILLLFFLSSRTDFLKLDKDHLKSLRLIGVYVLASAFIVSGFLKLLFRIPFLEAWIFSVLVCATLHYVPIKFKRKLQMINYESDISTPVIMILGYILIALHRTRLFDGASELTLGFQFVKEVSIGLGIGILTGIFVFMFLKRKFTTSKMLIGFAGAFMAYLVATGLGGNGFMSVIIVAFAFGPFFNENRNELDEFFSSITRGTEVIALLILGYLLALPWNSSFTIRVLILFAVLLLIRFSVVEITQKTKFKDTIKFTMLPALSPTLIPLGIIFLLSGNFTFLVLGYLLLGFVTLSTIVSMVSNEIANDNK